MRWSFAWWAFAGLTATAGGAASEGLRIVSLESFPAGTRATTEYISADKARVEWRVSSRTPDDGVQEYGYVHIRRCDLDKLIVLDTSARSYHTMPLRGNLSSLERAAMMLLRRAKESYAGLEIVVETRTVDTGERRVAFGHSARRVMTTRRQFRTDDPTAAEETVTNGWYIDLDTRLSCERTDRARGALISAAHEEGARSDPPGVTFKDIGPAEEGFPIETTVSWSVAGDPMLKQGPLPTTRTVVTHLSSAPLDPALFEVPVGFRSSDDRFAEFAASWHRKAHILRAVFASWFR